jgi:hypothetical protein
MNWKIWDRKKVQQLTVAISEHLMRTYSLTAEHTAKLQMASRAGTFVGDSTTYVRVFDPSLITANRPPVQSYKDLNASKGAVLFEGRWQDRRFVDVSDLRQTA